MAAALGCVVACAFTCSRSSFTSDRSARTSSRSSCVVGSLPVVESAHKLLVIRQQMATKLTHWEIVLIEVLQACGFECSYYEPTHLRADRMSFESRFHAEPQAAIAFIMRVRWCRCCASRVACGRGPAPVN